MIRAQSEDVPSELLSFFRSSDPNRDSDRFWVLLSEWYQDSESDAWHARWGGFVFPEEANFLGASFTRDANLVGATFTGDAYFRDVTFTRDALFRGATITGNASFYAANFGREASFQSATFDGLADFRFSTFSELTDFRSATFTGADLREARSSGVADFRSATGNADVNFASATFDGLADFRFSTFSGLTDFVETTFNGDADFSDATFTHNARFASLKLSGQRAFRMQRCSLAEVEFRSLDLQSLEAGVLRLAYADDMERLTLRDVNWPETPIGASSWWRAWSSNRPRTADEWDLDNKATARTGPTAKEVERVYRGLRKNHEDSGDRVGAHDWYFSEMEVGRLHAKLFCRRTGLKRLSRSFYKATSNYGLSAIRPVFWLATAIVLAFGFFSLGIGWCPARIGTVQAAETCVGMQERLQVELLAIFLQSPPSGIVMSGVPGQIVWLVLRVAGAAMLLSIGIAFRNQIAR